MTREQWMLAHALAGVVQAANAIDCEHGDTPAAQSDPEYVHAVATELTKLCSRYQIDSTLRILEVAAAKLRLG